MSKEKELQVYTRLLGEMENAIRFYENELKNRPDEDYKLFVLNRIEFYKVQRNIYIELIENL